MKEVVEYAKRNKLSASKALKACGIAYSDINESTVRDGIAGRMKGLESRCDGRLRGISPGAFSPASSPSSGFVKLRQLGHRSGGFFTAPLRRQALLDSNWVSFLAPPNYSTI